MESYSMFNFCYFHEIWPEVHILESFSRNDFIYLYGIKIKRISNHEIRSKLNYITSQINVVRDVIHITEIQILHIWQINQSKKLTLVMRSGQMDSWLFWIIKAAVISFVPKSNSKKDRIRDRTRLREIFFSDVVIIVKSWRILSDRGTSGAQGGQ